MILLITFAVIALSFVLAFAWVWWLEFSARRAAAPDTLFVCLASIPVADFAALLRFRWALRRLRLTWITAGKLLGRLELGPTELRWVPSAWTRRICAPETLRLPWADVRDLLVEPMAGLGNSGVFALELDNHEICAFVIMHRDKLQAALRELQGATPFVLGAPGRPQSPA